MKTLLLLRHAKSSWDNPSLRDFERPLNERGLKAAPLIGRYLRQEKIRPELILCSPAERARQTLALVLDEARLAPRLRYDERIYDASVARLVEVVGQADDDAETVLIVGHNPGMEELIAHLTGDTRKMATAALACISLDIEKWSKVREGSGKLDWLIKAKDLAEG
jgi:phosphohistidine phosphatase